MPTLYRGEPIPRLNDHEFSTGEIQSYDITVYEVTETTAAELRVGSDNAFFGRAVEDLPGTVTETSVPMTPGFSTNLGSALHFSWYSWDAPGIVFAFDSDYIDGVQPIEYTMEYMHEHPGILARIETLADAEVRFEDEVIGLVNDGSIAAWGQRVESRATSKTYQDEAEWVTGRIGVPLEEGLVGVYAFVGQNAATKGSIDSYLSNFEGYYKAFGTGEYRIDSMDTDEKLRHFHENTAEQMDAYSNRLVSVLLGDQFNYQKADGLDDVEIERVYNGESFSDTLGAIR